MSRRSASQASPGPSPATVRRHPWGELVLVALVLLVAVVLLLGSDDRAGATTACRTGPDVSRAWSPGCSSSPVG